SPPACLTRTSAPSAGTSQQAAAARERPANMTIHDYRHAIPGVEDITRVELDNGIVVLVRPNFTSPSVVVEGLVPGGALLEPVEKAGLANFHSALLMRGTKRRTFEEIYEEIESNGASLSFSAGGH